ncbi:MAG TPA: hypothetical protein G4O01_03150 [Dehalococcoidia bacterium]|nr:hypothetical protein [Dehalococcoidia bacterium]
MAEKDASKSKSNVLTLDLGSAGRKLLRAVWRRLGRWLAGKVVTLEIGSTSIRLMETRGGVVRKWADLSFAPDSIAEEEEAGSTELSLGTMVKQLMASSGIKARKVNVSLSGLYSISRLLPVSNLAPDLPLQEAALEMASQIMPLSEDRLHLFWQVLTPSDEEDQILFLGVPREVLDSEIRSLKAVGITPQTVELKAMALIRVVNREQALILNIEPASFDIIIIANGLPQIMHTAAWQRETLSLEDAAEYLASSLELAVDFRNFHHPDAPLDPATPLFITGQLSGDPELMEKLQAKLSYPVEPLQPLLECPPYLPVSQYAVNLGLALRGTVSSRDNEQDGPLPLDINLLPESFRPWRPTARQLYSAAVILLALVVLFPLFDIASEAMGRTAMLQTKFDILNQQLERKKLEIKKREPIQKAINEYRQIVQRKVSFVDDIEVIRNEAEKLKVKIGTITHEGDKIVFSCRADNYLIFREYLAALEESGRFTSPIPPPEGYPYTTGGEVTLEPATTEEAKGG